MPVLIIGVVFLALFLIMGVMSLSAVASEATASSGKSTSTNGATGIPTNGTNRVCWSELRGCRTLMPDVGSPLANFDDACRLSE